MDYLTQCFTITAVDFFMVGHTHCNIDQRFSIVGPILASASELETPEDFAHCIRRKHRALDGHELIVEVVRGVRDWKSALDKFGTNVCGHTGKGSAHSFRWLKYKNLDAQLRNTEFASCDDRTTPAEDDTILLIKSYMRDKELLHNPLVVRRSIGSQLD